MSDKKHILVVEDERHLAVMIKYNLEHEGYRVTTMADGPTAVNFVDDQAADVDLVILDLMLPSMSGYAVCESLRASGYDMPVLILSARTLSEDRTRGFDVGANQYLSKPFDLDELLSRVRNLLSHYPRKARGKSAKPEGDEIFTFDDAVVNFTTFEVTVRGQSQRLTQLELKLLAYFVAHEGRVIPRQELLEEVWGMPGHIVTRAVDQFILRLRKTFETDPQNPQHFLTIRDAGYRFVSGNKKESTGEAET
jgi:two-component system alkaline phosphatase synthesis response regulator PhoP